MEQIKTLDMIRAIRDSLYERTKSFSPDELRAFFHKQAVNPVNQWDLEPHSETIKATQADVPDAVR